MRAQRESSDAARQLFSRSEEKLEHFTGFLVIYAPSCKKVEEVRVIPQGFVGNWVHLFNKNTAGPGLESVLFLVL